MALQKIFRTDGWVKSTLGAAVPGAQVYVCTQPANVSSFPPTPLANVFSDVNGLVPVTQPIITDGFGHYDFYAPAGVYTIVIGLGGAIQQVYPDQSVGGASGTTGGGGGTALVLQVNGTPAVNQLLLNLAGQNSVSIADAGNGTINIAGASLQTNSVANALQSTLNLKSGSGISLTADGSGGVTVAATGGAVTTGSNIITLPAPSLTNFNPSVLGTVNSAGATNTFIQYIPGNSLFSTPSTWNMTIQTSSASTTVTMQLVKCAAGGLTVLTTTPITFGGLTSPTLAPAGSYTSDTISLQLSTSFDYYMLINSSTGLLHILAPPSASYGFTSGCYVGNTNLIGTSPLTFSGGTLQASKSLLFAFNAV
jgi:hypothetical protein